MSAFHSGSASGSDILREQISTEEWKLKEMGHAAHPSQDSALRRLRNARSLSFTLGINMGRFYQARQGWVASIVAKFQFITISRTYHYAKQTGSIAPPPIIAAIDNSYPWVVTVIESSLLIKRETCHLGQAPLFAGTFKLKQAIVVMSPVLQLDSSLSRRKFQTYSTCKQVKGAYTTPLPAAIKSSCEIV